LEERGLLPHFIFLDRRPDDEELFSWVYRSSAMLCLYGSDDYGRTKTSGARFIASAFKKPFIATNPALGLYRDDGSLVGAFPALSQCIDGLVNWASESREQALC
jgi:hypothetical protein